MSQTRTVTLELLRHGPPHNQLLSPLTQYLALCGNHSANTVTIPFEHNQLLTRLRALAYKESTETRDLQLKDTAHIMAEVLSRVPGLIAELAESPTTNGASLTHLRLILSASELALLPFELADAPNGFPGAGQPLALQAQAPLCVTREVRRVTNTHYRWPQQPRVLFVAASPPGVDPIPLDAHLLALRTVVDPWVQPSQNSVHRRQVLEEHLVVQTEASVASIQDACAGGDFTHIHVLAHGVPIPEDQERRYGLALHNDLDRKKADIVDGVRLATLLRTYCRRADNTLSGPAVVTLATCDGGNVGSVVGAGASIAHAIHEAGIPLVVAAQFPLSFAASVLLVEVLYNGLLWGADPRTLLNDLRWQLKGKLRDTHDWASLVAYASLPLDLDDQLPSIRISQAQNCINAALKYIDRVIAGLRTKKSTDISSQLSQEEGDPQQAMERARRKISEAKLRLSMLLENKSRSTLDRALIFGLLASTEKRDAEMLYRASLPDNRPLSKRQDVSNGELSAVESLEALKRARNHYVDTFHANRSSSWALVQELCITAVLDGTSPIPFETWTVAHYLSETELYEEELERRCWAHGSLLELYILSSFLDPHSGGPEAAFTTQKALFHADQLVRLGGRDSIEVYSTHRQIKRYTNWFNEISPRFEKVEPLALLVLNRLPLSLKFV